MGRMSNLPTARKGSINSSGESKGPEDRSIVREASENLKVQEMVSLIERSTSREDEPSKQAAQARNAEGGDAGEARAAMKERQEEPQEVSSGTIVKRKPSRSPPEPPVNQSSGLSDYSKLQWPSGNKSISSSNVHQGASRSYSVPKVSSGEKGTVYATVLTLTGQRAPDVTHATASSRSHSNGDESSSHELNANVDTVDISPVRSRYNEAVIFTPVVMRKKGQVHTSTQASTPQAQADYLEIYKCTNSPLRLRKDVTGRVSPPKDANSSRSKGCEAKKAAILPMSDDLNSLTHRLNVERDTQVPHEHSKVERTFTYTIERQDEDTADEDDDDNYSHPSPEVIHSSSASSVSQASIVPDHLHRNPVPAKRGIHKRTMNVGPSDQLERSITPSRNENDSKPSKSRGKWSTKKNDGSQVPDDSLRNKNLLPAYFDRRDADEFEESEAAPLDSQEDTFTRDSSSPEVVKKSKGLFSGWFGRSDDRIIEVIPPQEKLQQSPKGKDRRAVEQRRKDEERQKYESIRKADENRQQKARDELNTEADAFDGLCPSISIAVGKNAIATHAKGSASQIQLHNKEKRQTVMRTNVKKGLKNKKTGGSMDNGARGRGPRNERGYIKLLPLESVEREEEEDTANRHVPSPGGIDAGRDYEYEDEEEAVDESRFYHLDPKMYSAKKNIAQGLIDLSLLMVNASQLKYLLMTGPPSMSPSAFSASSSLTVTSASETSGHVNEPINPVAAISSSPIDAESDASSPSPVTQLLTTTLQTMVTSEVERESTSQAPDLFSTVSTKLSSLVTNVFDSDATSSSSLDPLTSSDDSLVTPSSLVVDATESAVTSRWSLGILNLLPPSNELPFYFYWISVSMIIISIAMQVILGILLLFNSRHLDAHTTRRTGKRAEYCNHFILLIILIITILNILIGVLIDFPFGDCNHTSPHQAG